MAVTAIHAQLDCSGLTQPTDWFAILFGRDPDTRPMQGLVEWHLVLARPGRA